MLRNFLGAICVALLLSFGGAADAQIAGISPCKPNSISVTGTTSNVALAACGPVAIVYNITSQEAFYQLGATVATTATTDPTLNYSLPGNGFVVLQVSSSTPGFIAAITATGTTTLRIVQGWAQP